MKTAVSGFQRVWRSAPILALTIAMATAEAAWVEIESENFIFVGETSEKTGKRIIRDLEVYRRTVLAIVGIGASPEQRKVRVFGLRGSGDIHTITGRDNIAGIYTVGNDYPVFVSDITGGSKNIRSTSYHEFAHHIINTYSHSYYPRWYNEGFAEFLGSFEAKKDSVIVGRPSSNFTYTLNDLKWLDIEILTNAVTKYPFKSNGSQHENRKAQLFYGMSWLAVHYIQNTPSLKNGFGDYIASLNRGENPTVAFEESFNIKLDDFYRELRQYWRRDKFTMFHFDGKSLLAEPEFTSRKLDDAEVQQRLAEIRVLFLPRNEDGERERDKAREKLHSLIAEFGGSVEFSTALVSLATIENSHDLAVTIAEQTLAEYPYETAAIQALADALFHRHAPGEIPSMENYLRSRELFAQVIERSPLNPTANSHYPATFVFGGDKPDEMALRAVNVDLQFHQNPSNFDTYLKAAEIYHLAGRLDYSCALIARVALWIRRDAESNPADETIEERKDKSMLLDRLNTLHDEVSSSC